MKLAHGVFIYHIWLSFYCGAFTWRVFMMYFSQIYSALIFWIFEMSKNTDHLYYTPEGCSLHGALQLAWIMGARSIYTIGCDSTTFGGKHYAEYDKNKFRNDEVLKRGLARNYDSYIKGTLIVQDFLRRKGVRLLNLSPIVGYHMVDYQYEALQDNVKIDQIIAEFTNSSNQSEAP
jgi:hypothetical protein